MPTGGKKALVICGTDEGHATRETTYCPTGSASLLLRSGHHADDLVIQFCHTSGIELLFRILGRKK